MNQIPYPSSSRRPRRKWVMIVIVVFVAAALFVALSGKPKVENKTPAEPTAALTVQAATATTVNWPQTLEASGSIAPWQEAIIGSEISGQRLLEVKVNVGDHVKKGQVLARYNSDTLQAEQAELQATWQQAESDRQRAMGIKDSGALSKQQIENYANQAAIAKARLDAKRLQLRYATVIAPDDGTVSARQATLGTIGAAGNELFRLILNDRIEWRGELNAEQLAQAKPGQTVALALPDGSTAQATIRKISPSLDTQSRLAIAYADIAPGSHAHAGMYASGTIAMQVRPALVIPAVSVVIRDGRSYVFLLNDATADKVTQQAVTTGRHQGSDVEIIEGLNENMRVVTQGAGFLNDADTVRVVNDAGAAK